MQSDEQFPGHGQDRADAAAPRSKLPDPTGPPHPVRDPGAGSTSVTKLVTTTLITLAAVGGVIAVCLPALQSQRTCGATRSSKLQWEQRQIEIDRVIAAEQEYRRAASAGLDRGTVDD